MNVYDFDKTIYDGDSTANFIKYCFKRKPTLVKHIPIIGIMFLKYATKNCRKEDFKETVYRILRDIPNLEEWVNDFWDKNESGIKDFYKKQKKNDDFIISASPEFLIKPICKKLGIEGIASRIDPVTGKHIDGINCHGQRKVERFYEVFQNGHIDEFYSDSYSDEPLALLADAAYIVKGEELLPWNFNRNK